MANLKTPEASNDKVAMFVTYSRFEFALKEAGFVGGADGDIASANWSKFARRKEFGDVLQAVSGDQDVADLIADPPKVQLRRGNSFEWASQFDSPITSVDQLFLAVKAVRDNLFHGGKAGENKRDDSLCRAGVVVIHACLNRHQRVRDAFEYKY